MALTKGDVVLVEFPFTDLSQVKLRPAIVLFANAALNEVTLCFISSKSMDTLTAEEFALKPTDPEFSGTGLRVASKARVTRIVTLQNQLVRRRLGQLGDGYTQQLDHLLKQAFQIL
jgi:mRNA interferase MazF